LINHEAQIDFLKQIIYQLELTASKLKTKNNLNNAELVGLGTIADYLKTFKTIMSAKDSQIRMYHKSNKSEKADIESALSNLPGLKAVKQVFK
jgi:hypothetical protein